MGKPFRSPLRGYNHNLGHLGRVFHVQTEDSGPAQPRLFTHLFFEGTILVSRKHEYDAAAPDDKVTAMMQAQHKMVIRDLIQAKYDERIIAFFAARGEHVAPLQGQGAVPAAAVAETPGPMMMVPQAIPGAGPGEAPTVLEPSVAAIEAAGAAEAALSIGEVAALGVPAAVGAPVPAEPSAPAASAEREASGGVPVRVGPRRTSTRPIETSKRPTNPGQLPLRAADGRRAPFVRNGTAPATKISSADGVVVQRSVVVGDPANAPLRPARIRPPVPYVVTGGGHTEKPPRPEAQPVSPPAAPSPVAAASPSEPHRSTTGGFGVADDKSLDEVILEYLSDDGD